MYKFDELEANKDKKSDEYVSNNINQTEDNYSSDDIII